MDVVVVGAGIAGISAARKLANHPGVNVTVLEARPDRYGGRIWTNKSAWPNAVGPEVEYGAAWIHGMGPDNPLTSLQKKLSLETFASDYNKLTVYSYTTGKRYSDEEVKEAKHTYEKTMNNVLESSWEYEKDISVQEAILKGEYGQWFPMPLSQFFLALNAEEFEGGSLETISARNYDPAAADQSFQARDSFILQGYNEILQSLVNGQGTSEKLLDIRLNKEVISVTVDTDIKKANVCTRDGDSFVCDAVVMAVPLGVLKADVITFSPPLPTKIKENINKIGIGYLNKLFLEFDKVFWPEESHLIGMISDNVEDRGFLWTWYNLYPVIKRPVMVGFLGGTAALSSEEMTQEHLIEIALQRFGKVFGESVVGARNIVRAARTRWASDPYARGTYTYYSVGNTDELFETFTSAGGPYIHFAGEHAAGPNMLGFAHGAYLSGHVAADRILATLEPSIITNPSSL